MIVSEWRAPAAQVEGAGALIEVLRSADLLGRARGADAERAGAVAERRAWRHVACGLPNHAAFAAPAERRAITAGDPSHRRGRAERARRDRI
jgi:hypothetical protein